MGDDTVAKEKPKSIIAEFKLTDLLPSGTKFEIEQVETRKIGAMTEGDVSSIYTQLQQGMRMEGNTIPKEFTYSAVREYYGL